jgi:hypothetical protein
LSVGAFTQRCKTLAVQFGEAVGQASGELAFAPEISATTAVMSLAGRASETIARNWGNAHRVVPLCPVNDEVFAWTGYREFWRKEGSEQNFRFIEGGFTLHVGRPGELTKPQILRSEWIGRRNSAFDNLAGHPHWQFDALESARSRPPNIRARFDDVAIEREAVEFGSEPDVSYVEDILFGLTIERMHLASAAMWWRQPGASVAHPAETVADVDRWALACIAYLRQELVRCSIVTVPFSRTYA